MTPPPGFAELYEKHWDTVYKTALRVTGNTQDAEDALQTVFLRILNHGSLPELQESPERYFRRAGTNAALDILRRKSTRNEAQLDMSLPHASLDSSALLKEQLRRAIANLAPRDSEMFTLRYVTGLSNGEISEIYGLEKTSVAVRLHRIRQMLQEEMSR